MNSFRRYHLTVSSSLTVLLLLGLICLSTGVLRAMSTKVEFVEVDTATVRALEPALLSSYPAARFYLGGVDAISGKWRLIRIVGSAACDGTYCPTLIKYDQTGWKVLIKADHEIVNTVSMDGGEFVQFELLSSGGRKVSVKYHHGQHIIYIDH